MPIGVNLLIQIEPVRIAMSYVQILLRSRQAFMAKRLLYKWQARTVIQCNRIAEMRLSAQVNNFYNMFWVSFPLAGNLAVNASYSSIPFRKKALWMQIGAPLALYCIRSKSHYSNETFCFHLAALVVRRLRRERALATTRIVSWNLRVKGIDDAVSRNFSITSISVQCWFNRLSPRFRKIAMTPLSEIAAFPH
jgi:hypothetical protein